MTDLPADGEGLSWIAEQDCTRLLLIPGLQPASIAAAAAGDQQALAYLRFTAQHHAAYPGVCALTPLDKACLQACQLSSGEARDEFFKMLQEDDVQVADVLETLEACTSQQLIEAARTGELAALVWMRAICVLTAGFPSKDLVLRAAGAGQLHILQYLRTGSDPGGWDQKDVLGAAVPHLDCLKWLLTTDLPGIPCPDHQNFLLSVACFHGLPALKRFREEGDLPQHVWKGPGLCLLAAGQGDQAMLEWLRAQNPPAPLITELCKAAARKGHIRMLGWLRSQDPPCPWDETVTAAGSDGSILQWLRAQDPPCPWGPSTCEAAVTRRDLETLKWLRAQDPPCPWDSSCCQTAAIYSNLEFLQWLRAQDPPCPWDETCFDFASNQPDVDVLQWLVENGCLFVPSSIGLSGLAYLRTLPVLEWLHDHGCLLTRDLYITAALLKQPHILTFLHRIRAPLPEPNDRAWMDCDFSPAMLMSLADIGVQLPPKHRQRVDQARRSHCTFYGLVRWYRRAISDASRGAHQAFDSLAADRSGQMLLYRLGLLPPELISKIAMAAEIQHEVTLARWNSSIICQDFMERWAGFEACPPATCHLLELSKAMFQSMVAFDKVKQAQLKSQATAVGKQIWQHKLLGPSCAQLSSPEKQQRTSCRQGVGPQCNSVTMTRSDQSCSDA